MSARHEHSRKRWLRVRQIKIRRHRKIRPTFVDDVFNSVSGPCDSTDNAGRDLSSAVRPGDHQAAIEKTAEADCELFSQLQLPGLYLFLGFQLLVIRQTSIERFVSETSHVVAQNILRCRVASIKDIKRAGFSGF